MSRQKEEALAPLELFDQKEVFSPGDLDLRNQHAAGKGGFRAGTWGQPSHNVPHEAGERDGVPGCLGWEKPTRCLQSK